jgi:hypothetical protein
MSYHKNERVNDAVISLLDALCMWERDTGQESILIMAPATGTPALLLAQDGKPSAVSGWHLDFLVQEIKEMVNIE